MPFSYGDGDGERSPQPSVSPQSPQLASLTQPLNHLATPEAGPAPEVHGTTSTAAAATIPAFLPTTPNDVTHSNISGVTDRTELIERIKAGETPTWVPVRDLSDRYYPNHTPSRPSDDHPDRPQSALHQGIFTNETRSSQILPGSPPVAAAPFLRYGFAGGPPAPLQTAFSHPDLPSHHVRTPSLSSFVLKTPTSPLVHSSNPDTDGSSDESMRPSSIEPIDIGFSERRARHQSLPPSALSTLQVSPIVASRQSRRLSGLGGGTASELPFGSFVGSYEESILNGRMSTTPSKPLNFLAQIGVLGLGKCKQSLRCPTHVTLPFPAYFYSVGDYDSPSPYVGQIDLDSALGSQSPKGKKPLPGVGGSYRIPQRGQLQIVIKNPNKTAVKLFLVPYDLRDMDPSTKTFIRQKAYSIGEIAGDLPVSSLTRQKEKDSLRYLIHLHIVCPSRGRYYIFRSIRVVFANRVPDGKERLRNEVLWPEPKYSAWKPESSCSTTPASSVKGRQRSASLYGSAGGGGGGGGGSGRDGAAPPPLPLLMGPPPPPLSIASSMDVGGGSSPSSSTTSSYEKLDFSSSLKKSEGRGLLAKRLRQLEVEALNYAAE